MVLQQNRKVPIRGSLDKVEQVNVITNEGEYVLASSTSGKWAIYLDTMPYGNPFDWNDNIKNPVTVRHIWADNLRDANLYDKEGLQV